MAQLKILALQYQQALDGLRGINCTPYTPYSDAADAAGAALAYAVDAVMATPGASIHDLWAALHPVVLETTLAASIVAYWERIPWAEVTPQRLSGSGQLFPTALQISSNVMNKIYRSALYGGSGGRVAIPIAALLLRQISVTANVHAAAVAGSTELATLLRETPLPQMEARSAGAMEVLLAFLYPFILASRLRQSSSAAPLLGMFWQRVMEFPSALAATVEALQVCRPSVYSLRAEVKLIIESLVVHIESLRPGNDGGRHFAGWTDMLGSDSLQQFTMEAILPASPLSQQPLPLPAGEAKWDTAAMSFLSFAEEAGQVSEARLSALLTHEGLIALLRAAAEGRAAFDTISEPISLLIAAWDHFSEQGRSPGGSPEEHGAALSAVLAALRQGTAMLLLRAVAPAQQQRAVRRARREGYLQGLSGAEGDETPESTRIRAAIFNREDPGAIRDVEERTRHLMMLMERAKYATVGMPRPPVLELREVMRYLELVLRCESQFSYLVHKNVPLKYLNYQVTLNAGYANASEYATNTASLQRRPLCSPTEWYRLIGTLRKASGEEAPFEIAAFIYHFLSQLWPEDPAADGILAMCVAHLLPLLRNVADGMPAELQADAVVALWTQHMLIQEKKPELVRLLDTRAPEVLRQLFGYPPRVRGIIEEEGPPLVHFGICKEWDYTVLMTADPLARILDMADSVPAARQALYLQLVRGSLAQLEGAADPLVPAAADAAPRAPATQLSLPQLRTDVADLMAAVRALPPLSMEGVGAAARLSLPQIGCSNPRCRNLSGVSEALLEVKLCAGCKRAQFCSRACQTAAWKHGHKAACQAEAARSAST